MFLVLSVFALHFVYNSHHMMMLMVVVMILIFICDERKYFFHEIKVVDPADHHQHLENVVRNFFMVTVM